MFHRLFFLVVCCIICGYFLFIWKNIPLYCSSAYVYILCFLKLTHIVVGFYVRFFSFFLFFCFFLPLTISKGKYTCKTHAEARIISTKTQTHTLTPTFTLAFILCVCVFFCTKKCWKSAYVSAPTKKSSEVTLFHLVLSFNSSSLSWHISLGWWERKHTQMEEIYHMLLLNRILFFSIQWLLYKQGVEISSCFSHKSFGLRKKHGEVFVCKFYVQ